MLSSLGQEALCERVILCLRRQKRKTIWIFVVVVVVMVKVLIGLFFPGLFGFCFLGIGNIGEGPGGPR